MTADPIRILIADDHLIIREGLRLILETAEGMELVGEASDGAEALRLAGETRPDVILMDLRMPGMDGLTAIQHLSVEHPQIAVVILTTYNEDDGMVRGLQAGARAYLLKDTDRQTLFNTIRAAARGETLLQPEVLARLLTQRAAPPSAAPELSERELEVLAAVGRGQRSKEIAYHLGISERTVKAHLASLYNKLGVDSRAAAVSTAIQRGLLSAGQEESKG
ncbi:response regulator [Levilinea saccharolytica]|uniref:Chemotaxis protein CheY n=1 Tax=Levilinea saccharolytica TaxID=229921 RepID=A0A0P6XSQ5_9CHLR|nr:response regulator transcription factor [Levilinea saccharolytica]KPL79732.1 chemotaxis protein CheY [Levilinea saccharolytica]GAP16947.1 two component transcriptional regulator, LuxR family [Levilinea saccharolytica]